MENLVEKSGINSGEMVDNALHTADLPTQKPPIRSTASHNRPKSARHHRLLLRHISALRPAPQRTGKWKQIIPHPQRLGKTRRLGKTPRLGK